VSIGIKKKKIKTQIRCDVSIIEYCFTMYVKAA